MNRFRCTLIFTLIMSLSSFSQTSVEWANLLEGESINDINGLVSDRNGDLYSAGAVRDVVDLDHGENVLYLKNYSNSLDAFIQKINNKGELIWAKRFGGTSHDVINFIGIDSEGSVYSVGDYNDRVDFDPGPDESFVSAIYDQNISFGDNVFIQKLDSNGTFVWVKSFYSDISFNISSFTIDAQDNLILGARVGSTNEIEVDVDPGVNSYFLSDKASNVILKLDSEGDFVWVNEIHSSSSYIGTINTDAQGNIYVLGNFYDIIDVDPSSSELSLTAIGESDLFIEKINADGGFLWAKSFGGANTDYGLTFNLDEENQIYIFGKFRDSISFNGDGNYFLKDDNEAYFQDYMIKLDLFGDLLWGKTLKGSMGYNAGYLKLDEKGGIYRLGVFKEEIIFETKSGDEKFSSNNYYQGFVQLLDKEGSIEWVTSIGGVGSISKQYMEVDKNGSVYLSGEFGKSVFFDSQDSSKSFINDVYVYDNYICKLNHTDLINSISDRDFEKPSCFPNPTQGIFNLGLGKKRKWVKILVRNIEGVLVYESDYEGVKSVEVSLDNKPGVYLIEIISTNEYKSIPVIVE